MSLLTLDSLNSDFICPFCTKILRNPVACKECNEINFCEKCLINCQKDNLCPGCHCELYGKNLKPNKYFLKIYNEMKIKCKNKDCEWSGSFEEFFQHEIQCDQNQISCIMKHYGCKWTGNKKDYDEIHVKKCLLIPLSEAFATLIKENQTQACIFEEKLANVFQDIENKFENMQKTIENLNTKILTMEKKHVIDLETIFYKYVQLEEKFNQLSENITKKEENIMEFFFKESIIWGEYGKTYVYIKDFGNKTKGSVEQYKAVALKCNKKIIDKDHPGDGGSFNSEHQQHQFYIDVKYFYENIILMKFPNINYEDILIIQGTSADAWAHNAEEGSMHAFSGPKGKGYAYCRGGSLVCKRYHIYILSD